MQRARVADEKGNVARRDACKCVRAMNYRCKRGVSSGNARVALHIAYCLQLEANIVVRSLYAAAISLDDMLASLFFGRDR